MKYSTFLFAFLFCQIMVSGQGIILNAGHKFNTLNAGWDDALQFQYIGAGIYIQAKDKLYFDFNLSYDIHYRNKNNVTTNLSFLNTSMGLRYKMDYLSLAAGIFSSGETVTFIKLNETKTKLYTYTGTHSLYSTASIRLYRNTWIKTMFTHAIIKNLNGQNTRTISIGLESFL